jgi:DeoR family deoxyribose operon repressor
MASNKLQVRLDNIIMLLKKQNGASIKQLASILDVTEMTVRRDLRTLQDSGIITIIHGAAIYNPPTEDDEELSYNIEKCTTVMSEEKTRIGQAAAALVQPEDILFIDTGTTSIQLIRHLKQDMDITLACFAFNSFAEAKKKNLGKILLGGGVFHSDTESFESPETLAMVSNIRATKAFIVPNAIEKQMGFMCVQEYEMNLKKSFISNSIQRIVLADSSKFGRVTQCFFSDFKDIDILISDSALSEDWRKFLEEKSIRLILV